LGRVWESGGIWDRPRECERVWQCFESIYLSDRQTTDESMEETDTLPVVRWFDG
jgi:hypothetical protein